MRKIISLILCSLLFYSNCFAEISINGSSINGVAVIGNNTWYRKQIVITGSPDSSLSSYPIMIRVHHGDGEDTGTDVYLNGNTKTDFSDVRFTSSNGTTVLKYWRESFVPADYAIFWVKVPSIPLSTASIYIYYGNASRSYNGDGDDVFTAFIDKDDADSFNFDPRWMSLSNPYVIDNSVNQDIGGVTGSQWYGMGSSIKLSDGRYLTHYMKYDGTSYSNDTKVEGQESSDKGKTWEGRQIVYDDPSYNSEIAGLIEKDSGNVVALVKLIDRTPDPDGLIGIKYAESTDAGVTWPDEASWSTAYGPTDYIHGIPDDWIRIGANWYAMSENVVGAEEDAYSQLLKYDGTTFSTVSQTPVTPDQTTEAAVASLGGENLLVIQRHRNAGGEFLDASTKTIKITSSNMGINWSSQEDIADAVGIIQDPNLAWVEGTPGNGNLMLFGRQGPNIGTSPDLTQQDNVAWFSDDNGLTWKKKTVIFSNTQTASQTVGGYLTAIVDDNVVTFIGWTDSYSSTNTTIAVKRMYLDRFEDYLLLHAYAQSNDLLSDIPFSSGGLTKYQIEIKSVAYNTPNTDITAFIFTDGIGSGNKVFQGYIPRTAGDIGFLNGATATSNSLYSGFSFGTKYILTAAVNTGSSGSELVSIKALSEDRTSTLATTTNKQYSLGSPTRITHLEVGTDFSGGRSLSHIDFIFLRKHTTNEPTITSYGVQESAATYPI